MTHVTYADGVVYVPLSSLMRKSFRVSLRHMRNSTIRRSIYPIFLPLARLHPTPSRVERSSIARRVMTHAPGWKLGGEWSGQ
jgi:hypothetical protein